MLSFRGVLAIANIRAEVKMALRGMLLLPS
jgi:hypothetical protein